MAVASNQKEDAAKEDLRPMIVRRTMPKEMTEYVIQVSSTFIRREMSEDDIAKELRATFDKKFGRGWNVIVGRDFGHFGSYFSTRYIFFYIGRCAIVLYKCPA
uniref:Dynein light chain n=1 Tax=Steinernema glaseri TaxID=37863 RepID=A0A1I7ZYA0_9BILA